MTFTRLLLRNLLWHWRGNAAVMLGVAVGTAVLTGALFNLVAYRTKSLASCVLVHAAVNLMLGIYIMQTGQWGFW